MLVGFTGKSQRSVHAGEFVCFDLFEVDVGVCARMFLAGLVIKSLRKYQALQLKYTFSQMQLM